MTTIIHNNIGKKAIIIAQHYCYMIFDVYKRIWMDAIGVLILYFLFMVEICL